MQGSERKSCGRFFLVDGERGLKKIEGNETLRVHRRPGDATVHRFYKFGPPDQHLLPSGPSASIYSRHATMPCVAPPSLPPSYFFPSYGSASFILSRYIALSYGLSYSCYLRFYPYLSLRSESASVSLSSPSRFIPFFGSSRAISLSRLPIDNDAGRRRQRVARHHPSMFYTGWFSLSLSLTHPSRIRQQQQQQQQ